MSLEILDLIDLEEKIFKKVVQENPKVLKPCLPLPPMLAWPAKDIDHVIKFLKSDHAWIDFKYDGERSQIHFDK